MQGETQSIVVVSKDPAVDEVTDPVVLFIQLANQSHTLEWAVDGVVVEDATTYTFNVVEYGRANSLGAGTYTVTARVQDETEWVRVEPRTGLDQTVSWTVTLTQ